MLKIQNQHNITDTVLMIRPANFGYNPETAENNSFQKKADSADLKIISQQAIKEFDLLVDNLRYYGIKVMVVEDTDDVIKSDAVFPNNWLSMHENGMIITYPMFAKSRRTERREDIIETLEQRFGFDKRYSFDYYEKKNVFLEGTGSMVLDRKNRIAYACLSERTDPLVLEKYVVLTNYSKVVFHAEDNHGKPIYHTNVMMSVGEELALVCFDSVNDEEEKKALRNSLEKSGKHIIDLSMEQIEKFAGNMLQLQGKDGRVLVMSEQAFRSLSATQVGEIKIRTDILYSPLATIETYGGGSARCMIAEIFYPRTLND